jgi:hypothetical protein
MFQPSVITISTKHEFSVNKYNPLAAQPSQSSAINNYNAYNEASNPSATQPPQTPTSPTTPTNNVNPSSSQPPSLPPTNNNNNSTATNGGTINSQTFAHPISANQTPVQLQQNLPILMDQLLAFNTALHKRQLGENFDDRLQLNQNNFIGKHIFL